jgi:AcrR family transcriptional regulator
MSPRADVSKERKKQILDAATNVFARSGFHQARMDDIAKESGLSKGALYWYFKNKGDIITAILESVFEREISKIEQMRDEDLSPREKIQTYINIAVGDVENFKPLMPILYEFLAIGFRRKSVRKVIQKYLHSMISMVVPLIDEGIESGDFKQVDSLEVAYAIGAIFEGSVLIWSYDPENVDVRELIESSVNLLLEGVENK